MNGRASAWSAAVAAAAVAALTLYAYRELPARPFAADDYQWLLNVRGLSFGQLARKAFDPGAQSHFFRPLVWLLFWAQTRAFGLEARGFHTVSLGLHLLNAGLLGWLFFRLTKDEGPRTKEERTTSSSFVFRLSSAALIVGMVALHPAPFEAVVWISAQSELLAALLLLAALHLWLCQTRARDERPETEIKASDGLSSSVFGPWSLLATLALGLALLAKESAVIGLPLLMLLGYRSQVAGRRSPTDNTLRHTSRFTLYALRFLPYVLPTLITLAYIALQVAIERRNYLLAQGGYGFGPQLLLNPLRSLALIVAPLPGSEHADAAWLLPVGAAVAIGLIGFTIYDLRFTNRRPWEESSIACSEPRRRVDPPSSMRLILALVLTLLPTAPFASPPDSRYLYLPVMAAALIIGFTIYDLRFTIRSRHRPAHRLSSIVYRRGVVLCSLFFVLAWWASGELHAREWRFAAASGPGGSLWRVASAVCAESRPDRMVIVEPPLAPPHVEAIVGLACGGNTRAKIVGRDQIDSAIKGRSVVIAFPNGSAEVQRKI